MKPMLETTTARRLLRPLATAVWPALLSVLMPVLAAAQTSPPNSAAASSDLSSGEVRRIDKEQKKITLRHGEIKNLEMPAMSMVFGVKDPALLDQVAVGDKVRFRAERAHGQIVVTAIER